MHLRKHLKVSIFILFHVCWIFMMNLLIWLEIYT